MRPELAAEAERLLWRYVVEVVERFALCPWARRARERGEVRVEIVAAPDDAAAAVDRIAAAPGIAMGMVVLPAAPLSPPALRRLRDDLLARPGAPPVAIAEFHPEATIDVATPARLIPWLRRSPDPTLQIVRLDVLAAARAAPPPPDRAGQAAILAGRAAPPPPPVADAIADANLATARAEAAAIEAAVAAIHADRAASYARLRERSPGPP